MAGDRSSGVTIRLRTADDHPALVELAQRCAQAGYPFWVADADLPAWLFRDRDITGWVAATAAGIVGHVSVADARADSARHARSAAGIRAEDSLVICRLLVDPDVRRGGLGRILLDTAVGHAHSLGLRPVLDVVLDYSPEAAQLYVQAGFVEIARQHFELAGRDVTDLIMAGPAPAHG